MHETKMHGNIDQLFPSLQTLEVYYCPLRLVSLPSFPTINYEPPYDDLPADSELKRSLRVKHQQRHVRAWARACRESMPAQIKALAEKIPLQRVRWVPTHYSDYSNDFDIIIRRVEGSVHVIGGFARIIPEDIPDWKREKINSAVDYGGPWEIPWDRTL
ncbi:hypothetical protein DL93DRAFT_2075174, partial [Clavulina sp. PMI_390]